MSQWACYENAQLVSLFSFILNIMSRMQCTQRNISHVEAWAEENKDDDHHYAFDSQFWHLGGWACITEMEWKGWVIAESYTSRPPPAM